MKNLIDLNDDESTKTGALTEGDESTTADALTEGNESTKEELLHLKADESTKPGAKEEAFVVVGEKGSQTDQPVNAGETDVSKKSKVVIKKNEPMEPLMIAENEDISVVTFDSKDTDEIVGEKQSLLKGNFDGIDKMRETDKKSKSVEENKEKTKKIDMIDENWIKFLVPRESVNAGDIVNNSTTSDGKKPISTINSNIDNLLKKIDAISMSKRTSKIAEDNNTAEKVIDEDCSQPLIPHDSVRNIGILSQPDWSKATTSIQSSGIPVAAEPKRKQSDTIAAKSTAMNTARKKAVIAIIVVGVIILVLLKQDISVETLKQHKYIETVCTSLRPQPDVARQNPWLLNATSKPFTFMCESPWDGKLDNKNHKRNNGAFWKRKARSLTNPVV